MTSGVLVNLIPGETFSIRLKALNLGGLSPPSNVVSYTTPDGGKCAISDYIHSLLMSWASSSKLVNKDSRISD